MKLKNGMMVLEERVKHIYEGFQGVVATLDPNTLSEDKKRIWLKEVQFNEEVEGYKAWNLDEFILEKGISSCTLRKKILNLLENHSETVMMGLPEIAITSDVEELLDR